MTNFDVGNVIAISQGRSAAGFPTPDLVVEVVDVHARGWEVVEVDDITFERIDAPFTLPFTLTDAVEVLV